ncbi:TetR/AcrR family transcriptional regulator [Arthrobacter sp. Z4-13]
MARGSYDKGIQKRSEILEAALTIIARNGYSRATVKELADAVGLTHNGVIYYFGSKDALFTEILRRRDQELERTTEALSRDPANLRDWTLANVVANINAPGLVELYARLSNEASESDHPAHAYFQARYEWVRGSYKRAFTKLLEMGVLPADADPDVLSISLIALIDGLQTQWMYDPGNVDMSAAIEWFFHSQGVAPAPVGHVAARGEP